MYRHAREFARKWGESKTYPVSATYKLRRYWGLRPTVLFPCFWAIAHGDGPDLDPDSTGFPYCQ